MFATVTNPNRQSSRATAVATADANRRVQDRDYIRPHGALVAQLPRRTSANAHPALWTTAKLHLDSQRGLAIFTRSHSGLLQDRGTSLYLVRPGFLGS